jgi:peptidylprolyl isomerase
MWLIHNYGMVGAGRDKRARPCVAVLNCMLSSGRLPRHLDRNVTLFGRVIMGWNSLSAIAAD